MKKILFLILVTSLFLFPQKSKAGCGWGDFCAGEMLDAALEEMSKQIQFALVGALKQTALQTITDTVNNAISGGGGSGGPMFITNWEEFLIREPEKEARLVVNTFFDQATGVRGFGYQGYGSGYGYALKDSGSKVAGAESIKEGIIPESIRKIEGNYQNLLVKGAENVINSSIPSPTMTSTSGVFDGSTWGPYITMMGTDTNTWMGFNLAAESVYSSALAEAKKEKEIEGVAYGGYKAVTSGDSVITPGSTIEAIQAQAEDLGNKILAGANSMPEVLTSLVSKLATKTLQQGIGQAQSYVQREVNNKVNNYSNQLRNEINPSKKYKPTY